ncbi:MAG: acyl-CoA dehydrogenase family protein, partial [Halieaceae bacterium]|nr:acyl-CoA dehydrogenase family protein [Halieaceae bacterium]
MDFNFTEDQQAIRDLAAQIFRDRASDEFLLQFSRSDATYDDGLWQTLAEQGLLGIAIPEAHGGSGLGLVELCLMLEEQGRTVAPIPLFASLVLGAMPLVHYGSEALQADWLPRLVAGEVKLSAAIAEMNMNPALREPVRLTKEGDSWVMNGLRKSVPDGAVADAVLVPGVSDAGDKTLFLVPVDSEGVTVTPLEIGLSGERAAHLRLDNVKLSDAQRVGDEGKGGEILGWLEERANVAHCAMQTGVSEEAMKRTAAYLGERKQFGVPLGSFQALAMRMAD